MARALRAWAINRGGKNSVRNLRYGPRTRLVRGISSKQTSKSFSRTIQQNSRTRFPLKNKQNLFTWPGTTKYKTCMQDCLHLQLRNSDKVAFSSFKHLSIKNQRLLVEIQALINLKLTFFIEFFQGCDNFQEAFSVFTRLVANSYLP